MPIVVKALAISCVAHLLGISALILAVIWCIAFRGGLSLESDANADIIINLHPLLMLIVLIIGREAIMIYKSPPLGKPDKMLLHNVLHLIAIMPVIIGIYTKPDTPNLHSLHSLLGVSFIILYGIQNPIQRESLPRHIVFGMAIYMAVVATAELGFLEKLTLLERNGLGNYSPEAFLVYAVAVVTFLFDVFVVLTPYCQPVLQENE